MTKKCFGCGIKLQNKDAQKDGYVLNSDHDLCQRCFKVRNYGEYKPVAKSNEEFMSILREVDKSNNLVLLIVDLFNIPKDLNLIIDSLSNDKILVLNKRDVFAKDIYNQKFLDYFKQDFKDKIIVSSKKNYNFDNLLGVIRKYKNNNNVYVVGFTNAGKSTLINQLIHNYSNLKTNITTSVLPSTTLDLIKIKLNDDITLIDTPGILDNGDISNYVDSKVLSKLTPRATIRPITYQVKEKQYFNIDNLFIVETSFNNITFFISKEIEVKRTIKTPDLTNLEKQEIEVGRNDLVVSGLGFIKFTKQENINVYAINGVDIYTRESLI